MKNYILVLDGKIVNRYSHIQPFYFGGDWENATSIEIPEGVNTSKAQLINGEVVEVEPPYDYISLRAAEYPSMSEYLDGVVKSHSEDQTIHEEGVAQIEKYIQDCLAVKVKYPKPSEV